MLLLRIAGNAWDLRACNISVPNNAGSQMELGKEDLRDGNGGYIVGTYQGGIVSKEAIEALRFIYQTTVSESDISLRQADEARAARDYRAADRHQMYSLAMRKIRAKALAYARGKFLADISEPVTAATLSESSKVES